MLRRYESRRIDLAELNEWLVQAEYDDDLPRRERDILAGVRLVAIEAAEGFGLEAEVLKGVSSVLGDKPSRSRRQPA